MSLASGMPYVSLADRLRVGRGAIPGTWGKRLTTKRARALYDVAIQADAFHQSPHRNGAEAARCRLCDALVELLAVLEQEQKTGKP